MQHSATGGAAIAPADALWQLYQIDLSGGAKGKASVESRASLEEAVGTGLLTRYNYNRWVKKDPVTRWEGGKCAACGTQYHPSHQFSQLTGSGEVRGCYNCGRLLAFVTIQPDE